MTGSIASLSGLANLQTLRTQDSYIYGDTTAVAVSNTFEFSPCADLGSCGSGSLVANASTYAGTTAAACCGTARCTDNVEEESGRRQPDFNCSADASALSAFRANSTDPDGKLSSWSATTDPCGGAWDGVACWEGDTGSVRSVERQLVRVFRDRGLHGGGRCC